MSTSWPPKKNAAFTTFCRLTSQATPSVFQTTPTLAAGDVKVSIDGGALANLATLPVVTPAGAKQIQVDLSAAEMNGNVITVLFSDAAGAEWCDHEIVIHTSTRQVDDLAYPATSGRSVVVDANGLVDANAVKIGPTGAGTAQTARDVGASVLLSTGTGAGQLDFTAGVVKSNLSQILGTALTESAGQIAAAFKKFFNIATPAATMDHGILVDTVTTYSGNTPQTGDAFARIGLPAGASVSADVAAVKGDTAAIKTKTDSLTFTRPNEADVNVQSVNDTPILGAGAAGNLFRTS